MNRNTGIKKMVVNQRYLDHADNNNHVKVERDDANIYITIPIHIARTQAAYDISRLVIASISPVFLNQNHLKPAAVTQKQIVQPSFTRQLKGDRWLDIGIMMESVGHYTGGRYYVAMMAATLAQYCRVTLYTNRDPIFPDGLIDKNSSLTVKVDSSMGLNNEANQHDLVIGSPANGGRIARSYAEKWDIPHHQIIFETPNWISKMRDGDDGTETYWRGYKDVLRTAAQVICISHEGAKHAIEWAELDPSKITVIYPSINSVVAKQYLGVPKERKEKLTIVCSHRLVQFKNPVAILKKLNPKYYTFRIIGKSTELSTQGLAQMREKGFEIYTYKNVTDQQKFELIRKADVLLFPTEFEGFGIPPAEAMYMGTAVFTYDIPVLREVYGAHEGIRFVPVGDVHAMVQALTQEAKDRVVACAAEANTGVDHPPCSIRRFKDDVLRAFNIPKVTAGIIAYNSDDYIQYAIQAIQGVVDQVVVVDGAVRGYIPNNTSNGRSTDQTAAIVKRLADKDVFGRIELVTIPEGKRVWEDKMEMQNEIARRVKGDFYVKVDSDEIWKREVLVDAVRWMAEKELDILKMPFFHFWLNFKTLAVDDGGKWSTRPARIWRWREGMKHTVSFNFFVDKKGKKVDGSTYVEGTYDTGEGIYHFGYVRALKILQNKIRYYKNRGIEKVAKDTVTDWAVGQPTQPTQDAPSTTSPFTGELPDVLQKHPYADLEDIRQLIQ